ncbi:hypothetical protein FIV07_28680 (plasmid) [Mycobacterium sp. THAF192]|nr:hypothetical protein FIV07_28680 [Mycobacterium sp. THAF192]
MGISDRRLRAFFATRGYPDPATVSQERTIWAATERRTRTSRICSASSTRQAVTVIDPEILKAVQTVYSTDLSLPEEWTQERRNQFLTAEADKISSMAASMAEELWEKALAAWSRQRHGQTPNHATKVALLQAARAQAAQTVLNNELYDLIETDETTPEWERPDPVQDPAQLSWEQRWTNPAHQSEPTEALEALIDRLWPAPDYSGPFRIKAGYLTSARAEDGLALPARPEDPLTAELAQMIYRDLRADGLPER